VAHDFETGAVEQLSILGRVQAAVVQRVPLQVAYCTSFFIAAGEHQRGIWRSMSLEPRKHGALIVG